MCPTEPAQTVALVRVGADGPAAVNSSSFDPTPCHPTVERDEGDRDLIGQIGKPPIVGIVVGRSSSPLRDGAIAVKDHAHQAVVEGVAPVAVDQPSRFRRSAICAAV